MWSLIFSGNWFAFSVLIILLLLSILSWTIIIIKWFQFRLVHFENGHFQAVYTRDQPLSNLYNMSQKFRVSPLARMFDISYREIATFRAQLEKSHAPEDARERLMLNLSRSLEKVYNQQIYKLERSLGLLATVSGSAPYIGLFGTVLGIIDAFAAISTSGVTSLSVVAPGIAEALVATAAGLMAAIPALIAYNIFRNRLRGQGTEMKNFALDVSNRLERLL